MEKDIVCGMEVKDTSNAEKSKYKGKTYYFCTTLCRIQFEQDPEKYLSKNDAGEKKHQRH